MTCPLPGRDRAEDEEIGTIAPSPLFDHSLVARLVEVGYVQTEALPTGAMQYEITEAGKDAIS
jgi:hypothetical protein